jgi:hypothetical protein
VHTRPSRRRTHQARASPPTFLSRRSCTRSPRLKRNRVLFSLRLCAAVRLANALTAKKDTQAIAQRQARAAGSGGRNAWAVPHRRDADCRDPDPAGIQRACVLRRKQRRRARGQTIQSQSATHEAFEREASVTQDLRLESTREQAQLTKISRELHALRKRVARPQSDKVEEKRRERATVTGA